MNPETLIPDEEEFEKRILQAMSEYQETVVIYVEKDRPLGQTCEYHFPKVVWDKLTENEKLHLKLKIQRECEIRREQQREWAIKNLMRVMKEEQ